MAKQIDLIPELRAHIARKYKNQAQAARAWGISDSMVSLVLLGKKNPTETMLEDAGIEAIRSQVQYVRKKEKSK